MLKKWESFVLKLILLKVNILFRILNRRGENNYNEKNPVKYNFEYNSFNLENCISAKVLY